MGAQMEVDVEEPALAPYSRPDSESIPGIRKAAMLLVSLGDQIGGKILSNLSEE